MNQSDYAERHGVSRKTVTDWKKRGWLVFAGDDIEPEASDAMLRKYRKGGSKFDATGNTELLPDGQVTAKVTESADVLPDESIGDAAAKFAAGWYESARWETFAARSLRRFEPSKQPRNLYTIPMRRSLCGQIIPGQPGICTPPYRPSIRA